MAQINSAIQKLGMAGARCGFAAVTLGIATAIVPTRSRR
jgi:hypothetical protein